MVEFPCSAFGEKPDYSNFNKSSWKMRDKHSHNEQASLFEAATTLAAQKEIKRKYGVQYELPYYSAPQMCIVDPMHLQCHLKECIIDYGPVYTFWLFAYERLNGIMGSYHTNCKNISVQLTRRFVDSIEYAPSNWSDEFAEEFLPLISKFQYKKGSLIQANLEMGFSCEDILALPPLQEGALSPDFLNLTLTQYLHQDHIRPIYSTKKKPKLLKSRIM